MHYAQSDEKLIDWIPVQKKPIMVHAIQIVEDSTVETMEGTMRGKAGDYLMRGIEGELYICDQDIFHKTYRFC